MAKQKHRGYTLTLLGECTAPISGQCKNGWTDQDAV